MIWNSTRTITSNQDPNTSNCEHYEFTKTVKDSLYDPSGNHNIVTSLVNIVLDPTQFTYVPPTWLLNWPTSTNPSNTGGYATATNPAGVAVNVTYNDNSNQNSDTTKCEHYNYNLNRTWTATTTPCNDQINSSQEINMQEIQPPIWTFFPNDTTIPVGGSINPDNTGWPEGQDPFSGMPVNKNWYDSVTNQTSTQVYIDRHWNLSDICNTHTNDSVQNIIQDINIGIPGVNGYGKGKTFYLYPNPSTANVNFHYITNKPEKIEIKVNDMTGKQLEDIVIDEQTPGKHNVPYDVSGLPAGIYLINYTSPESNKTEKLVKIR